MSRPLLTVAVRRLEEEIGAGLMKRGNRFSRLTLAVKNHARLAVLGRT
jgi:DNA-binding transcriptional LysR family regulator